MTEKQIRIILLVTGAITMASLLQFVALNWMLDFQDLTVTEDTGRFFAQHWGLVVFCIGALLVYAAYRPAAREAIVLAGLLQKLGLVILLAMDWSNPALEGLHAVAVFDAVCVVLYAAYLITNRKKAMEATI